MIRKEQLYEQILEQIDLTKETDDEELQELIRTVLDEAADEEYISLSDKIRIGRELFNSFRKLDVLQELLEDDSITEIMVNGIDHIFYEKEGRIFRSKKCFLSQERLLDVIQQIVGESNRYVNEASPIVDARLKDGSRVNVVLNPVAVNGPILTIRKFPSEAITMEQLIRIGSVTDEAANFLKKLVAAKYNIFVSGGTGAGKTTFLNALSNYIPKGERLITIEDNAELQIQGVQNLVRLEARGPNAEGEGAVTIRDLIKSALRMRPDRIVVGEVRGEETVDMISSAMLNGHSGSMSTGHANNPTDMLRSLLILLAIAVLCQVLCSKGELRMMVAGGLCGGVFLFFSWFTQESFGYGDSILILILGILSGGWNLLWILFAAFLIASVYGGIMIARKKYTRKNSFTFIPFLTVAYLGGMIGGVY